MLVTAGGATLAAGAMFVVMFPLWYAYPLVGLAEVLVFAVVGVVLLLAGASRRRRSTGSR